MKWKWKFFMEKNIVEQNGNENEWFAEKNIIEKYCVVLYFQPMQNETKHNLICVMQIVSNSICPAVFYPKQGSPP